MKVHSKDAVVLFIIAVKDAAVIAGVLILLVTIGALGASAVYCWHEWVLKLAHYFHHR